MAINSGNISMKTFSEHVSTANWTFTLSKSSLKALIAALGGPYEKSKGADLRIFDRSQLEAIQGCLWPLGEGSATSPWGLKKVRYKHALGYLANTLFNLPVGDALLVASYKTDWASHNLTSNCNFVSKSGASKAEMSASGGLRTRYASELCIPEGGMIGDWIMGHKYIFCGLMRVNANGSLKSEGKLKTQGFGENTYCFQRRALTQYMCRSNVEASVNYNGEIAFPDDIDNDYIKVYTKGVESIPPLWVAAQWI